MFVMHEAFAAQVGGPDPAVEEASVLSDDLVDGRVLCRRGGSGGRRHQQPSLKVTKPSSQSLTSVSRSTAIQYHSSAIALCWEAEKPLRWSCGYV